MKNDLKIMADLKSMDEQKHPEGHIKNLLGPAI
jgi:hypothetical protein